MLYMSVSHKKAPPRYNTGRIPSLYFDPDIATALAQPDEPGTGKQFVFEVTLGVLVDDLGEFYRHMSPARDPERIGDFMTYIAERFHISPNGAPKKNDCPMWEPRWPLGSPAIRASLSPSTAASWNIRQPDACVQPRYACLAYAAIVQGQAGPSPVKPT